MPAKPPLITWACCIPLKKHPSSFIFSSSGSSFNCHFPVEGALWGVRNTARISSELCREGQVPESWREAKQACCHVCPASKKRGLAVEPHCQISQSRAVSSFGGHLFPTESYENWARKQNPLHWQINAWHSKLSFLVTTPESIPSDGLSCGIGLGLLLRHCPLGSSLKNSVMVILLVFLFG